MGKSQGKSKEKVGPATISNRRASFDYEFLDTYEAGIALIGSEVKSVYKGRASLVDAYCRFVGNELWMMNADIEPYEFANRYGHERRRDRKLLMHRAELRQLQRKMDEKGLALIPHRIYFKGVKAKVAISLARGKKTYDKRESLKDKEVKRDLARELAGD